MFKNKYNFKESIFYRFIKVLTILFFIFVSSIIVYINWGKTKERDNNKSFIRCDSGKEFTLSTLSTSGLNLYYGETKFDNSTDNVVKKLCFKTENSSGFIPDSAIPTNQNYSLYIHSVTEDYLQWIFIYSVLEIIISYLLINIIREVLFYIVFGKKISKDVFKII